jgi:hypothetical protein
LGVIWGEIWWGIWGGFFFFWGGDLGLILKVNFLSQFKNHL